MSSVNAVIEPVSWLLGKWRSEDGMVEYPTMENFPYGAEIEFTHIGQPNIHFSSVAWHKDTKKPLHREAGFIRVKSGTNKIALMSSQNIGLSTMEEGEFHGKRITLESHTVARMSFVEGTQTKKVNRVFELDGSDLVYTMAMETNKTPLSHHLKIRYNKVQ